MSIEDIETCKRGLQFIYDNLKETREK
jgi:hypothetical protein